jgi:hypothetical protein
MGGSELWRQSGLTLTTPRTQGANLGAIHDSAPVGFFVWNEPVDTGAIRSTRVSRPRARRRRNLVRS